MLTISTTSYCWRWPQRTRDRLLFLYLKPVIFGPLVSPTTRAATLALFSSSGVERTVSPSTTSTGVSATSSPTAAPRRSTWTRSPWATRVCFPPVFTTAYIGGRLYRVPGSPSIWLYRRHTSVPPVQPKRECHTPFVASCAHEARL